MAGTETTNKGIAEKEVEPLAPSMDEVLACQFSSWYPIFSALPNSAEQSGNSHRRYRSNVTIKSIIIDLPDDFEEYLRSDQLILPDGTRTSCALLEHHNNCPTEWSSEEEDDNDNDDNQADSSDNEKATKPQIHSSSSVPDSNVPGQFLHLQIENAINSLGGAVLPKLNWSAPRDAIWINTGTLECRTAGDVYLLLKASDFCWHDVQHAFDKDAVTSPTVDAHYHRPSLQLALRKWCPNLYPCQEFRCFVGMENFIAISQRHHAQHWPHLMTHRSTIQLLLRTFWQDIIQPNITLRLPKLHNYVFDVYMDRKERVWLMDINVWGSWTDALLFEWEELVAMMSGCGGRRSDQDWPIVRIVETEKQLRADPLACYRAPIDAVHMMSSGIDSDKIREFMNLCQRPNNLEENSLSSSSDVEDK